jgi:hypothetical protein
MKTIRFSGQTWFIKNGNGLGPGNNNWYEKNVYVDREGNLHLRINKIEDKWYCAEIFTEDTVKWGEYTFFVSTNLEKLDKNIVIGLFIYQDDKHELDIEFNNKSAFYSEQPSNTHQFKQNLQGDYSTHRIIIAPYISRFISLHGHYNYNPDQIIDKWTSPSENIPEPLKSHIHINFWLKNGKSPTDGKEAEIVVKSVTHRQWEPHFVFNY